MNNKIEERYRPPFAVFKHRSNTYVIRPLDWEGAWDSSWVLQDGDFILNVKDKDTAEMIANTFNRFFELSKEIKDIKKYLRDEINVANRDIAGCEVRVKQFSGRASGKTYLANEIMKNSTAIRCFEHVLDEITRIEKKVQEKYES